MSGTLLFQVIAQNISPEKLQIINVHPGAIYSAAWKDMGLPPKLFDHGEVSLLA
jgi:hypothetical protein